MDIRKVKKLIELLEESEVAEIEIHEGEESVRISRYPAGAPVATAPVVHHAPAPAAAPAARPAGPARMPRAPPTTAPTPAPTPPVSTRRFPVTGRSWCSHPTPATSWTATATGPRTCSS